MPQSVCAMIEAVIVIDSGGGEAFIHHGDILSQRYAGRGGL